MCQLLKRKQGLGFAYGVKARPREPDGAVEGLWWGWLWCVVRGTSPRWEGTQVLMGRAGRPGGSSGLQGSAQMRSLLVESILVVGKQPDD